MTPRRCDDRQDLLEAVNWGPPDLCPEIRSFKPMVRTAQPATSRPLAEVCQLFPDLIAQMRPLSIGQAVCVVDGAFESISNLLIAGTQVGVLPGTRVR